LGQFNNFEHCCQHCDQIGRHLAAWATLSCFLRTKFSLKQSVSTHGLLWVFQGFKSGLMLMFWAFKLSFDIDVWAYLGSFFKIWAKFY
jgi:hypothetical protein